MILEKLQNELSKTYNELTIWMHGILQAESYNIDYNKIEEDFTKIESRLRNILQQAKTLEDAQKQILQGELKKFNEFLQTQYELAIKKSNVMQEQIKTQSKYNRAITAYQR